MTNLEALRLRHEIERRLLCVRQMLELAELKDKHDMVSPDLASFITQIDTATDKIAARIQALINKPSAGLSDDDKAALQAEVDKLNLMGQDPNNPLPPVVTA